MHILCPLYNVLLDIVCCCFPNCIFKLGTVRQVTELHLSTKFHVGQTDSAAVSELRESNQNKEKEKNSEIDYFQFKTFPGHIIYPFFNQRYLLSTCTHLVC